MTRPHDDHQEGSASPLSLDLGTLPAREVPVTQHPQAPAAPPAGPATEESRHTATEDSRRELLHHGRQPPRLSPHAAAPAASAEAADGTAERGERGERGEHDQARAWRRWLRDRFDAVPLTARLLTILLALLVVALGVSGYATQGLLRGYLVGQVETQLDHSALALTRSAYYSLNDGGTGGLPGRGLAGDASVRWWLAGTTAPQTVGPNDTSTAPALNPMTTEYVRTHLDRTFTVSSRNGDRQWLVLMRAYQLSSGQTLYSEVALPLDQVTETLARLRLVVLAVGTILVVSCAVLGSMAIRSALEPLREVEDTAAAIAAGDLSRRVRQRPSNTEVGRLTTSLNGMLAQIEQAFRHREASEARTRRFAADASHELRTPLASIRGFAELYRQGAVPADDVPRTMRRIEEEATRMGGLVEDLLLLARLDEQRPGRCEPVDLAVLANDAVHDARGLDPTRRVSLVGLNGRQGPSPALVVGDEDRLRQVVANLMGNAVRHTPVGTSIDVAVGVSAEPDHAGQATPRAVLEVRDHGQGLPPEQADRIFERFYRVDSSRSRGSGGGNGLGLSIVAAVVAAHGGRVEAAATPGGGATFRVEMPAAPPGATPE